MITAIITLLTVNAFSYLPAKLDMKPVYLESPAEDIVTFQPVLSVEVIRSADMQVISTDDATPATQIELAEVTINSVKAYKFTIEGRELVLEVKNQRIDDCNSSVITAVAVNTNVKLELQDHTERLCKDYIDNTWVATVNADNMKYELAGQPN